MIDPAELPLAYDLRRTNGSGVVWLTCSCHGILEPHGVHQENGTVEVTCKCCGICVQLRAFRRRLPDGGKPGTGQNPRVRGS